MLTKFENKRTDWIGLWYHPETHCYTSPLINLSAFKDFKGAVRITVRKNQFYKTDSGRPNYILCFSDSESTGAMVSFYNDNMDGAIAERIAHLDDDKFGHFLEEIEMLRGVELFTRAQVEAVKYGAAVDGARGFSGGDLLIEDYI